MDSRDDKVNLDIKFFSDFSSKYKTVSTEWRIDHSIVKFADQLDGKYVFKFNWIDVNQHSHLMKAVFSKTDKFIQPVGQQDEFSWVMKEEVLQSHFLPYAKYEIKKPQQYCSFKLYEVTPGTKRFEMHEVNVLSIWFTLDALYGELHKVKKGRYLSGNDVITMYLLFDKLFQIQNTFINDVSSIESANKAFAIPLRLISAIATGKTWYQHRIPGLTLFDCKRFPTIVNGVITQDFQSRNEALNLVRKFPLYKWYGILDSGAKKDLLGLYNRHIKETFTIDSQPLRYSTRSADAIQELFDKKVTIQRLTAKIYNQSRKEKSVTNDLIVLTCLLTGETDSLERIIDLSSTDSWLKTKVNQLLSGSTFWIKKVSSEPILIDKEYICMS